MVDEYLLEPGVIYLGVSLAVSRLFLLVTAFSLHFPYIQMKFGHELNFQMYTGKSQK